MALSFTALIFLLFFSVPPNLMQDMGFSRAVYDRNGTLLRLTLASDQTYRLFVPLDNISPTLVEAVLLREDNYFYSHMGVNPVSLGRALWYHVTGSGRGGASTLTMQLVRLKYRMHTRGYLGKLWQMAQALRMELHYSKRDILEAYLNLAPYGGNIEGVGAASRIYFGREVDELSLPEALTLAAVPQSPRAREPGRSAATAQALMKARLREFGEWKERHPQDARYETLLQKPMRYGSKKDLPFIAPQWTSRLLHEQKAATITTTLDAGLQELLAGQVQRYVQHQSGEGIANAAALLVDSRDMSVLASVGSADYFNLRHQGMVDGTQARRSPGSALKPFIYALAFEQGIIHPMSLMIDAPTAYGAYAPENFDRLFQGPLSAHDALIKSRNIPALWLAAQLKPDFYAFLQKAGIGKLKPKESYGLSLVLGGAEVTMQELVQLYAALAQGGSLRPLRRVMDEPVAPAKQLMRPEAAFMALDIVKDTPPPGGSATADTLPLPVYWKTGTSGGLRDAWSVGVFGPYVLAVWVGDFRGSTHGNYVGITHAAPLFFDLMRLVAGATHPQDVVQARTASLKLAKTNACADTGDIDSPYCPSKVVVWTIPGISPIKSSGIYRRVLMNRQTGKLSCRFADGVTDYRVLQFWPSEILHVYEDAGIHKPPSPQWEQGCEPMRSAGASAVQIVSPARDTTYHVQKEGENKLPLKATLRGGAQQIFWFVDNVPIAKTSVNEPVFINLKQGKHKVRVVDEAGNADSSTLLVE